MDLSVIFGTWNRLSYLGRCVDSIRRSLAGSGLAYEIVITDGGSTDGAIEYLVDQPDVRLHVEAERRGAVAAFNNAFARSKGSIIVTINDDIEVLDDALAKVAGRFDDPKTGQLALSYRQHNAGPSFRFYTVHNKTYANYSVLRRDVAEMAAFVQGGYWNPCYHTYAGDTELSCWIWKLGFHVVGQPDLRLIDWFAEDELRAQNNSGRNVEDGRFFHRRWQSTRHLEPDGPLPLELTPGERERFRLVRECVQHGHAAPVGQTQCARCGLEAHG
jgi:glycosyltransferase involved in cell wall biosynthesis